MDDMAFRLERSEQVSLRCEISTIVEVFRNVREFELFVGTDSAAES